MSSGMSSPLISWSGVSVFDQVVGVGLLALLDLAVRVRSLALLDWAAGVGLLALLDWAVGVGLLAWVSCGYVSTTSYLVQAWTTPGHLGLQLGGTLCHQSLPLALTGVSYHMLNTGGHLHGMSSIWVIWT